MIAGINDYNVLVKHISCECKCNLTVGNVTRVKSGIIINVAVSAKKS